MGPLTRDKEQVKQVLTKGKALNGIPGNFKLLRAFCPILSNTVRLIILFRFPFLFTLENGKEVMKLAVAE